VKPGIVAAAILAFISSWNNFLFAAVLGTPETRTLPVVVYNMLSFEQANWGPLAAAATLVCLPVIIGAIFFQRHLVEGLTAGAVKG
jgi:multiple sugar transport system permease protein